MSQPTQHVMTTHTSWQTSPGAGDATRETSADAYPLATPLPGQALPQSVYYLMGVDVEKRDRFRTLVTFGDSITDGFQGNEVPLLGASSENIDRDGRWPDQLARRLARKDRPIAVSNAGISGNQLLADASIPVFGPAGLRRMRHDALGLQGVSDVVLLEGINDIGQSSATAEQLKNGYRTFIGWMHAPGIRVHLGTITPQGSTNRPGYGQRAEPTRQRVNRWIRRQRLSDSVIDFARVVQDPADHRSSPSTTAVTACISTLPATGRWATPCRWACSAR